MKSNIKTVTILILFAAMLTATMLGPLSARADGGYSVNWWSVDSGGGNSRSAGGQYTLGGTIGQPDAGYTEGGDFSLQSGFWVSGIPGVGDFSIYLPLVVR